MGVECDRQSHSAKTRQIKSEKGRKSSCPMTRGLANLIRLTRQRAQIQKAPVQLLKIRNEISVMGLTGQIQSIILNVNGNHQKISKLQ